MQEQTDKIDRDLMQTGMAKNTAAPWKRKLREGTASGTEYNQKPLIEVISSKPLKKEPAVLARKKGTEEIVNRNIVVTGTTMALLSVGYWLPYSAKLLITLPMVYTLSGRMIERTI